MKFHWITLSIQTRKYKRKQARPKKWVSTIENVDVDLHVHVGLDLNAGEFREKENHGVHILCTHVCGLCAYVCGLCARVC